MSGTDAAEIERLRREAAELRALARELSARLSSAVAALPLDAALALARGGEAAGTDAFHLENWNETIEITPADVRAELELLWKRLPPRESP